MRVTVNFIGTNFQVIASSLAEMLLSAMDITVAINSDCEIEINITTCAPTLLTMCQNSYYQMNFIANFMSLLKVRVGEGVRVRVRVDEVRIRVTVNFIGTNFWVIVSLFSMILCFTMSIAMAIDINCQIERSITIHTRTLLCTCQNSNYQIVALITPFACCLQPCSLSFASCLLSFL